MSAPLIWIFLPFIAAVGFWFIKKERTLTLALGGGFCALLFVLTYAFQLDIPNNLGPISFQVSSTVSFLGRKFVLVVQPIAVLAVDLWIPGCVVPGRFDQQTAWLLCVFGVGNDSFAGGSSCCGAVLICCSIN